MKTIIILMGLLLAGCSSTNTRLSVNEAFEFCESMGYKMCSVSSGGISCGDGGCFSDADIYQYTNPPIVMEGSKFEYIGFNKSEEELIQIIMIEPLKEGYLDGVNRITFTKYSIEDEEHYGGVFYPNNKTIRIRLYMDNTNSILHLSTLCHELLHLHGLKHSKVMRQLDNEMICYDIDKLNEQLKDYDCHLDNTLWYCNDE